MEKEKANIDEIINRAIKIAIREYDREIKAENRKKVLHNTKLLMKHYNDLKSHIDNAISDIHEIDQSVLESIGYYEDDELFILSIKKSKIKTLIMVSHIDVALDILYKNEMKNGTLEKYLAIKKYFIEEKTFECIAEELNCGVITVRRWVNEMLNYLGIYLFGVESIF